MSGSGFSHQEDYTPFGADTPAPRTAPPAAPPHVLGNPNARRTVTDVQWPNVNRRTPQPVMTNFDPATAAKASAFIGGSASEASYADILNDAEAEAARKLARAREVLAAEPDAVELMKRCALDHFADYFGPASSLNYQFAKSPGLHLALTLLELRDKLIAEPDDARKLVLLSDAAGSFRGLAPYTDQQARQLAETERMQSVTLIARFLGLPIELLPNTMLPISRFDPIDGEVPCPQE